MHEGAPNGSRSVSGRGLVLTTSPPQVGQVRVIKDRDSSQECSHNKGPGLAQSDTAGGGGQQGGAPKTGRRGYPPHTPLPGEPPRTAGRQPPDPPTSSGTPDHPHSRWGTGGFVTACQMEGRLQAQPPQCWLPLGKMAFSPSFLSQCLPSWCAQRHAGVKKGVSAIQRTSEQAFAARSA